MCECKSTCINFAKEVSIMLIPFVLGGRGGFTPRGRGRGGGRGFGSSRGINGCVCVCVGGGGGGG